MYLQPTLSVSLSISLILKGALLSFCLLISQSNFPWTFVVASIFFLLVPHISFFSRFLFFQCFPVFYFRFLFKYSFPVFHQCRFLFIFRFSLSCGSSIKEIASRLSWMINKAFSFSFANRLISRMPFHFLFSLSAIFSSDLIKTVIGCYYIIFFFFLLLISLFLIFVFRIVMLEKSRGRNNVSWKKPELN